MLTPQLWQGANSDAVLFLHSGHKYFSPLSNQLSDTQLTKKHSVINAIKSKIQFCRKDIITSLEDIF